MLGIAYKRLQQGNITIVIAALAVIILTVGGVFVVLQNNESEGLDENNDRNSIETKDESSVIPNKGDWETYTVENNEYRFSYPNGWVVDQWNSEYGHRVHILNFIPEKGAVEDYRNGYPEKPEGGLEITILVYPKENQTQELLDWVIEWNKRPMGWGVVDVASEEILDYGGRKGVSYLYHSGDKEVHYIESSDSSKVLHILSEGNNPNHRETMETFIANIAFLDN